MSAFPIEDETPGLRKSLKKPAELATKPGPDACIASPIWRFRARSRSPTRFGVFAELLEYVLARADFFGRVLQLGAGLELLESFEDMERRGPRTIRKCGGQESD
jgi:hypothetical protein